MESRSRWWSNPSCLQCGSGQDQWTEGLWKFSSVAGKELFDQPCWQKCFAKCNYVLPAKYKIWCIETCLIASKLNRIYIKMVHGQVNALNLFGSQIKSEWKWCVHFCKFKVWNAALLLSWLKFQLRLLYQPLACYFWQRLKCTNWCVHLASLKFETVINYYKQGGRVNSIF